MANSRTVPGARHSTGPVFGSDPLGRPYPRPYLLAFFGLVRRDLVRRELLVFELLWRELLARVVHDPIGPHQPAVETPKRLVDVSKELQRIDTTRATGPSPGSVPE